MILLHLYNSIVRTSSIQWLGIACGLAVLFLLLRHLVIQFVIYFCVFQPPPSHLSSHYLKQAKNDKNVELICVPLVMKPHQDDMNLDDYYVNREPFKDATVPMRILHHPQSNGYTLLFSHANASDMYGDYSMMQMLRDGLCMNVVQYEYPGYGLACTTAPCIAPSEDTVQRCAIAVMRHIMYTMAIPEHKIVLMGMSLGGAPTIYLASHYKHVRGMVLLSAFASITRCVPWNGLGGVLPHLWDMFCNVDRIKDCTCRILLFHGTDDWLVPYSHAQQLAEEALSSRRHLHRRSSKNSTTPKNTVHLIAVSEAGHNDVLNQYGWNCFCECIWQFVYNK